MNNRYVISLILLVLLGFSQSVCAGYDNGGGLDYVRDSHNLSIHDLSGVEAATINGNIALKDQGSIPSNSTGYGKLYVNGGNLYYQNGSSFYLLNNMNLLASSITANSLDFDSFKDTMSLDATTAITMANGDLNFHSNTLFIDSSENSVGIGNGSPTTALAVTGTVTATLFNGDGSGLTALPADLMTIDDLSDAKAGSTSVLLGEDSGGPFTGANNVALGVEALANSDFDTDDNVAIGYQALYTSNGGTGDLGDDNVAIGSSALYSTTNGDSNVGVGKSALYRNTTGYSNVSIGTSSIFENTAGYQNTSVGYYAMYENTIGVDNTSVGAYSSQDNSTGSYNTALGASALGNNESGSYNTAIGHGALLFTNGASRANTALGYKAGEGTSSNRFDNGTFLGYHTGLALTTGDNNIMLGYQAGDNVTTGSNNLIIGYGIDAPSATGDEQLVIGNLLYGTGLDGTGTTVSTGNIGIATTAPDKTFEINSSAGNNLRLTYNDSDGSAANYSDFAMSSGGNLTVTASGGEISFGNENLTTTGTLAAGDTTVIGTVTATLFNGDGSGLINVIGNNGIFAVASNVISNNGSLADYADDFVVGSPSLDYDGNISHKGRFFFDKSLAAFRVGYDTGQWDSASIGSFSFASGSGATASGTGSVAFGKTTVSSANYSMAFGEDSTASANHSIAGGDTCVASGDASFSFGMNNTASGDYSVVMGRTGVASGNYAFAYGYELTASGLRSIAMGRNVTASATDTVVIGRGNSNSDRLVNSSVNTLMIGFNSNAATLYVGAGAGGSTVGNVGIGTTSPAAELEVVGDVLATTFNGDVVAGSITASAGSESAPPYTFTGDTDTGVYNDSADTLALTAGGVGTLYVKETGSTGNVGIDDSSPDYLLDVNGIAAATEFLAADGSAADPAISFSSDPDTGIYRSGTNVMNFAINGTFVADVESFGMRIAAGKALLLESTDSPPGCTNASKKGGVYFDASMNEPCFCDGSSWKQFDGGGNCT